MRCLSRARVLRKLKKSLSEHNTFYTQSVALEILQAAPKATIVRRILRQSQQQVGQCSDFWEPIRAFFFPLRLLFLKNPVAIAHVAEVRLCQNPKDTNAHRALAAIAKFWEDWESLLDTYTILRSLCGDTAEVLKGLAQAHEALGNQEEYDKIQRLLYKRFATTTN